MTGAFIVFMWGSSFVGLMHRGRSPHLCESGKQMTGVFVLFERGTSFVRIGKGDDQGLHFVHAGVLICANQERG
jgi:hypothetical protein